MVTRPARRLPAGLTALLLALFVLAGCGSINRLDPPPLAATPSLPILGIDNARFWPDAETEPLLREVRQLRERQAAAAGPRQVPPARNPLPWPHGFGYPGFVGWRDVTVEDLQALYQDGVQVAPIGHG